jgi:hypothetical protein
VHNAGLMKGEMILSNEKEKYSIIGADYIYWYFLTAHLSTSGQ